MACVRAQYFVQQLVIWILSVDVVDFPRGGTSLRSLVPVSMERATRTREACESAHRLGLRQICTYPNYIAFAQRPRGYACRGGSIPVYCGEDSSMDIVASAEDLRNASFRRQVSLQTSLH